MYVYRKNWVADFVELFAVIFVTFCKIIQLPKLIRSIFCQNIQVTVSFWHVLFLH